ncbi:hypothetical protein [Flexithrix dorotheae]|uniref:hypothetical protein n=1 Tax=Flexithrix dorotheae TaxID=70993 RepID=UPI0012F8CEE2|nr:hypothetical protein [Flexithrix dorotheae]
MILSKKILLFIISALTGLTLIPFLALEARYIEGIPILIFYFLPVSSLSLIILFELITRLTPFKFVFKFIIGFKIFFLFIGALIIEWIIMWKVNPVNDVVFTSQFATGIFPAIIIYGRLGNYWKIFPVGKSE